MNFVERLLIFTFLISSLWFCTTVFADEPTSTQKKQWVLDAPTFNGTLFNGGHTDTIDPADEYILNSENTVTVYNTSNSFLYIFTADPQLFHQYRLINYRVDWENDPTYAWKDLSFTPIASYNQPFDANFLSLFGFAENEIYLVSLEPFWMVNPWGEFENRNWDYAASSSQDLYDQIQENNWDPNPPGRPPEEKHKPYFYLKSEGIKYDSDVEYTLTWDTDDSSADPPEDYGVRVYVSKDNRTHDDNGDKLFDSFDSKKAIRSTDQYPVNLGGVSFSFTLSELRNLYLFGGGFLDHNFYIYVNLVSGDNEPSDYWVYFQVSKMFEITSSASQILNPDGTLGDKTPLTERENGIMDYTDDRPTGDNTGEDGEREANGSAVSPNASNAGINNYTPTTSQELGINYGTSLNDLASNLGGLVNTLSNLPLLFATVCSWLPTWLITLISVSIGMVVVIGSIKLILR